MKMQTKHTRKRLLVDVNVQRSLILRVLLYWVMWSLTVVLVLFSWRLGDRLFAMSSGDSSSVWRYFRPPLIASIVILPVIIYDILQFSNRFCGPLFRIRRSLQALNRGERVAPIQLRKNDFWKDFAQEINTVLTRVQREPSPPEPETAESEAVGAA
jgi:hypothetical protein